MSKTKEELNEIKKELESLNKKLAELTDEEIAEAVGGSAAEIIFNGCGKITSPPDLPATTLDEKAYKNMFNA